MLNQSEATCARGNRFRLNHAAEYPDKVGHSGESVYGHGFAACGRRHDFHPTINGQVVGGCPVINGATDCQRVMASANAICREYGFRHAGTYHLRPTSPRGLQLILSIDSQETVFHSEWVAGGLGPSFDAVECSK